MFNALSQALGTGRGADIIISHRATQDGIAAYHMMVVRYCFGGDIETFKKKQNDMLTTNFHRNYTGGALAFLDDWERAAVKLAAASPSEALTDQQKRSNFSMRFSVLGLTDTLVDSVMDDTTSWHQFTDTLRRRLVRRQDQEGRDCIGAKMAVTKPEEDDEAIKLFLATTLEEGWKVGDLLWKHLTKEQRMKLIAWRKEVNSMKNPSAPKETTN